MAVIYENGQLKNTAKADPLSTGSPIGTAWKALPTYQNSWADKALFQAGQYRMSVTGRVELRGTITEGTKTTGTLITTLPAGFRPAAATYLHVVETTDATSYAAATLLVGIDGTVKVGGTTTTLTYVSLEGASFDPNAS